MGKRIPKPPDLPEHPKPQLNRMHRPACVSFRRVEPGAEFCLSLCTRDEVREFVDALRQLSTMTWQQVLQTGGKGKNKAGLAYTPYSDGDLHGVARPAWLSEDVKIAAVRASQKQRMFGVYLEHTFYILWFDRNHEIVKV